MQQLNTWETRTNTIHRPGTPFQLSPTCRHHHLHHPHVNYLPSLLKRCTECGHQPPQPHICSSDGLKKGLLLRQAGEPTVAHVTGNLAFLPFQPPPICHSMGMLLQPAQPQWTSTATSEYPIIPPSLPSLHSPEKSLALFLPSQLGNP